jgi:[histone H3]-lysine9 N-trimethyltransferase SUV39H
MEKPLLAIFTAKDVPAYRELCFSYFGSPDDDGEEASIEVRTLLAVV